MVPMSEEPIDQSVPTLVYYSLSGFDAMAVLRVIGPASFARMKIVYGYDNNKINVEAVKQGDIVVLQRDICRYHDKYEQIIALAHAENKPVVFDLDDLLFELPENHPDRISGFYAEALLPMLQAVIEADLVTVATEPLKEYLLPYNQNIALLPNYLNDRLWDLKKINKSHKPDELITIGYMGGHSHKPDLLMVISALKSIMEKYPGKIRFHFWGIEPPDELFPYSQVDWCPPPSYDYADFVKYFQTQHADIAIAPLGDNLFNHCKSPIKYLEFSANAMPGVYSRVTPYEKIITHGEDGYLASSTEEWVDTLSTLVERKDIRYKFIENAQNKIRKNWLLSNHYQNQVEIYQDLCCGNWVPRKGANPIANIVNSFSLQYGEEFDRINARFESLKPDLGIKDQTIEKLNHQLDDQREFSEALEQKNQSLSRQFDEQQESIQELYNQNATLEDEVVSYAASKSWRYTRPLRRLNRLLKKVFR